MGVPDAVALQPVQVDALAEPQGGGVDARLIALGLDFLAEGDGTLGAVLDAQTIGTAIAAAGSLGIKVDGVVELAAVQDIGAALRFFPGLKVGVYFFSQAVNENEAREEAQGCSNMGSSTSAPLP